MKPGLISRGYNSNASSPQEVFIDSLVSDVGDEALMIKSRFQKNNVPVFVGKRRAKVAKSLLNYYPDVNILISDDGLQHYELERDFEIVVVDGDRGYGNNFLMPAGPLREPISRVNTVDAVVLNGLPTKQLHEKNIISYQMKSRGDLLVNCLHENRISDPNALEKDIIAVTGIGNPQRFKDHLSGLNIHLNKMIIFDDHHSFTKADFNDYDNVDVIMTEKDAVKCKDFAKENFWYLPIFSSVEEKLFKKILEKLRLN
jgi:tetraacyldisaccharide 4'-kinase